MENLHDYQDQRKLWNGDAGSAWVESQDVLDQMFQPIEALLVDAAAQSSPKRVLDVGCGTGGTTLALARRLGKSSQCVGMDLSQPMIDAACDRAAHEGAPATFICDDAQTHAFEPASLDGLMSRFGVMFFEDSVQAFANLRRAARDQAQLCFMAWRSAAENPFMTTAERAAASLVSNVPARDPEGPGQFAFAKSSRIFDILTQSGWSAIDIAPIDVTCTFAEKDLQRYFTRLGPLGRILAGIETPTRQRVIDTVHAAFAPYVHGAQVKYVAACWMVVAYARG